MDIFSSISTFAMIEEMTLAQILSSSVSSIMLDEWSADHMGLMSVYRNVSMSSWYTANDYRGLRGVHYGNTGCGVFKRGVQN